MNRRASSPVLSFRGSLLVLAGATALLGGAALRAAPPPTAVVAFIDRHCADCHNDVDKEARLDLTSLAYDPADGANFALWVKVHDRVKAGEMPPKKKARPAAADLETFV